MPRSKKSVANNKPQNDENINVDCLTCDNGKQNGFYVSNSKSHKDHKLPWCKKCVENQYNKYFLKYGDGRLAIYYTCRKFDIFYSNTTYEGASNNSIKTGYTILQSYFKLLNSFKNKNGYGDCFDDSWNFLDLQLIKEQENKENSGYINEDDIDELSKFWGKGYSEDDYVFLQEYYNGLIKIYDHSLPVQINNYKNMAKTQLQANKCLENNDINAYEKAMKILSLLCGDSNIKPVQETSVGNITKGGFDVFIKHIEDDEPVLDWEKDLGNKNSLKEMLSTFFFGNLARALGIKNPYQEEFEEEMKKYTVEESEVEEEKNQVDYLGDV